LNFGKQGRLSRCVNLQGNNQCNLRWPKGNSLDFLLMSSAHATPPQSQTPKVSVIIPAYNTAAFIAETLNSVFGQTFQDFEVIIVNDGSPDTAELEVALQPYRDRIRYIKQENKGLPGARNVGIGLARGELLAFVDSDDLWMPDYLLAQVEFLDAHPQVYASIADALLFGSGGDVVWRMLKDGAGPILGFEEMLKRQGGQLPSAMVARRQRVVDSGLFDERIRIGEDVEFCVRLVFPEGAVGYLGRVLVKYRQRPGSLTEDPRRRKWKIAEIESLHRVGENLELNEAQRKLLDEEIAAAVAAVALGDAYHHISLGEYGPAVECFRSANAYYRDSRISVAAFCLQAFPWLAGPVLKRRFSQRPVRKI
jgi:glycosyltransferase involved in cell wall biosynthesis